jgi:hypothetical protein
VPSKARTETPPASGIPTFEDRMTVNTTISRSVANGDGTSITFAVPFYFLEADDLLIYVGGVLQAITTDYAVSGAGNAAGGSITFTATPPAGSGNVVIIRDPDLLQSTKYPPNDPFPAQTHETALDKLTMLVQRARDLIGRAFTFNDADTSGASLAVPSPQAGYLIGWNGAGNGLANFANIGDGSGLPLPVSITNGGTGASTASLARTNLGVAATGAISGSGLTMNTGKLLARGSAGSGVIEEITPGAGLSVSSGGILVLSPPRSYLAGLGMTPSGSTISIAAGQAVSTDQASLMNLNSAMTKTTSAWAAGSGNGGLDTGAIANNTWYHFYLIRRVDTGVVDALFSVSASAPTLPSNYTQFRRMGSAKTNGASQWIAFVQTGDYFEWVAMAGDNTAISGTATLRTLASVPTGVSVAAHIGVTGSNNGGNPVPIAYHWNPALGSTSPGTAGVTAVVFNQSNGPVFSWAFMVEVITNTSGQIYNQQGPGIFTSYTESVAGYFDSRDRYS